MLSIQELRGPKVLNMAVFDWVATAAAAVVSTHIIYRCKDKITYSNYISTFVILIVIAIITHVMIKQPTMLNAYLGLNNTHEVMQFRKKIE